MTSPEIKGRPSLVYLFLFLVALWTLTEGLRVSRSYYNSQDDIYIGVVADHMKLEGLKPYWASTRMYSHWQGRAYFYFSFFFFMVPFLTNSVVVRTATIVLVELAAIGAIGLFLGFYLKPVGGMLFTAGSLCLLPHWNTIHPVTAHPVGFQMPLLCFFSGMSLYICSRRRVGCRRAYPRSCFAVALLLVLASLFFYELLIAPFFLIAAAVVWAETDSCSNRVGSFITGFFPFCVLFFIWTTIYIVFRHLHPSTYEGAKVAAFDASQYAIELGRHLASSLPGAHGLSLGTPGPGGLRSWGSDLGWGGLCITVAAFLFIPLSIVVGRRSEVPLPRLTLGSIVVLALLIAILAPAPIFLTAKYRNMPLEDMPYLPGYYSYLAFMAIAATAMIALSRVAPVGLRIIGVAVLAILFTVLTATANVADNRLIGNLSLASNTWKAVDLWMQTKSFHDLPSNAVVLAPTLWDRINPIWWFAEDYWSHYVLVRSGRNLRIVPTMNEALEVDGGKQPIYYAEHEWGFDSSVLLLTSRVERQPDGRMKADSVTINSNRDFPHPVLDYAVGRATDLITSAIPALERGSGYYSGSFLTPGLLVGSARVDGENRSDTFLMQKARVKFDLAFQGNSPEAFETVQDGDFYERGLTLQPGRNEMNIKCYGARMAAPGDPRFIVFGIKDWSVTPR